MKKEDEFYTIKFPSLPKLEKGKLPNLFTNPISIRHGQEKNFQYWMNRILSTGYYGFPDEKNWPDNTPTPYEFVKAIYSCLHGATQRIEKMPDEVRDLITQKAIMEVSSFIEENGYKNDFIEGITIKDFNLMIYFNASFYLASDPPQVNLSKPKYRNNNVKDIYKDVKKHFKPETSEYQIQVITGKVCEVLKIIPPYSDELEGYANDKEYWKTKVNNAMKGKG